LRAISQVLEDSKVAEKEEYECSICQAKVTQKKNSGFTNLMNHLKEPGHYARVQDYLQKKRMDMFN
jgi:hypothetical protein